jgi:HSP20 family molecular chaperone IbpA
MWVITTDTMQNVIKSIRDKQEGFNRMQTAMVEAMKANYKIEEKQQKQAVITMQLPGFLKTIQYDTTNCKKSSRNRQVRHLSRRLRRGNAAYSA